MARGLYRSVWENVSYCQGLSRLSNHKFEKVGNDEGNFWRELGGYMRIGRKMSRIQFQRIAAGMHRLGMGDMPGRDPTIQAKTHLCYWHGFKNDGACADCLKKTPITRREWARNSIFQYGSEFMAGIWHMIVITNAYGRFYNQVLDNNDLFNGNEGGFFIERQFSDAMASTKTGMECFQTAAQAYDAWISNNTQNADEWRETLCRRVTGLPQMTDMALEREWCATCQSNLVPIPHNPFPAPR